MSVVDRPILSADQQTAHVAVEFVAPMLQQKIIKHERCRCEHARAVVGVILKPQGLLQPEEAWQRRHRKK